VIELIFVIFFFFFLVSDSFVSVENVLPGSCWLEIDGWPFSLL
jgi:hypothetical protein